MAKHKWIVKLEMKKKLGKLLSFLGWKGSGTNHCPVSLHTFLATLLLLLSFFNEANIKVILFQLRVGIYSLYLVMLIKNIIFMYLSQRKYHFIKIQLDSDNICKDYWITAVWTYSALFYFHHPNKRNHNKQTKEKDFFFINLWGYRSTRI